MRLTARRAQNQLDWSVLDIEQEEWNRRMADLGVAAVANGFPVQAAPAHSGTHGQEAALASHDLRLLRMGRHVVLVAVAVLVLAALMGYGVWRTAQAGIVRMEGDVANAVKLETIRDRAKLPVLQVRESIEAVEFVDDRAMATVVVSSTLPSGRVLVEPATRFYKMTATGWQRTAPVAAFWGPTETLDTASLHFIFGNKDRALAERTAPTAESLYTALRRATGQELAADGLLTVEIVPGHVTSGSRFEDGRIRVTSPLLYRVPFNLRGALLDQLLRQTLAREMLAAALQSTAVKPQWQAMVEAFAAWLRVSEAIQPAPAGELASSRRQSWGSAAPLPLDDLVDVTTGYGPEALYELNLYLPGRLYLQERRRLAAEQLIDFIALTYGIDVLPELLQGLGEHEGWETLAPAVLDMSAAELEAGWHAGS